MIFGNDEELEIHHSINQKTIQTEIEIETTDNKKYLLKNFIIKKYYILKFFNKRNTRTNTKSKVLY